MGVARLIDDIVECKGMMMTSMEYHSLRLIDDIVECKDL